MKKEDTDTVLLTKDDIQRIKVHQVVQFPRISSSSERSRQIHMCRAVLKPTKRSFLVHSQYCPCRAKAETISTHCKSQRKFAR
jgi:hypothetical protein